MFDLLNLSAIDMRPRLIARQSRFEHEEVVAIRMLPLFRRIIGWGPAFAEREYV
jgi:hypothetical protein